MRKRIIYSTCLLLIVALCGACRSRVKLPPLAETFAKNDKNPFGSFVLHNQLEQMYYHNSIRNVKDKFEATWQNISDTSSVYIGISKNLFLSKADLTGMLAFVYNGNSLFISSDNIDQRLLDTLGCKVSKPFYGGFLAEMKYTSVKLATRFFNDSSSFQYFYLPFYNHFIQLDTPRSRVLGTNKTGANFLVVFHGKGRFFIHLEPRALSNYFLLQKNNYNYLKQVFSFTPAIPEHVYWDDYYHKETIPALNWVTGQAFLSY
ncbi:MAG: DUF4350 domain-containing protein [Ferruginibacter sp.]